MSRKSRQKKGRSILAKLPPVGVLVFLLVVGLGMGPLSLSAPWTSRPVAYEDTIPLTATIERVTGDYEYHRRRGWDLDEIHLYFIDHDRLYISSKVSPNPCWRSLKPIPPARSSTCGWNPTALT